MVEFASPATKALALLVTVQFVDDINIPCISDVPNMTAMEVMVKLQEAIDNLEVTGGSLKPNNCFWYLIGF